MKKKTAIFISIYLVLLLSCVSCYFLYYISKPRIKNIDINSKLNKDNTKTVTVKFKVYNNKTTTCSIDNKNWMTAKNNKCTFNVSSGKYQITIKNLHNTVSKNIKVAINEYTNLKIKEEKYYLAINEAYTLNTDITKIGNPKDDITWSSSNEQIATVNDGTITGISKGETIISLKTNNLEATTKIIVTDLINKPTLDNNKKVLPCNYYNEEDAQILDDILKTRIEAYGLGTRAAAIEALRFLPLSFKFKVPYFFENGRLNPYDRMHYVDGEGRYYHQGLYLHKSKFSSIKASFVGPAIWGCPLTNYDDSYGWKVGAKYPNGLDCSGFITWVLYNSGQDIGDIGSGITANQKDVSDLGKMHTLTYEYANKKEYKVGDIIARDGHTAMIAGIDDENIYIAESLLKGVKIEKFSYTDKNSKLTRCASKTHEIEKSFKI